MRTDEKSARQGSRYVRFARFLCKQGSALGITSVVGVALQARGVPERTRDVMRRKRRTETSKRAKTLETDLQLAGMRLEAGEALAAAMTLFILMTSVMLAISTLLLLLGGIGSALPFVLATVFLPILSREVVLSYPSMAAKKAADEVLKTSSGTVNLMIMSLRHEPSISRAISFASVSEGRFSRELKTCAWGVIMGKYSSFEEALIHLGQKWSRFSEDLKASLNAMVTASRESTEDGKRRALDRANGAMISGAKRRIEEYALSLSMPSMLIFGLGILLPLMVGSFMPMLSWNLWSTDGMSEGLTGNSDAGASAQMVFVMNVLFPSIAAVVAMNAISGHPFVRRADTKERLHAKSLFGLVPAVVSSVTCFALAAKLLDGIVASICLLLSVVIPASLWLLLAPGAHHGKVAHPEAVYEDALFKTGARMLEGENYESSLHKAGEGLGITETPIVRRLSFRETIMGQGQGVTGPADDGQGVSNAREGLRITRLAAEKDELAAGILAMDLAAYLRDLRELDGALRNRLRPTISMMKTTSLILAPVVLGVTYAIYLSLSAMIGGDATETGASVFFVVLGIFLAEMDAIVVFFVNGISGDDSSGSVAFTLGWYLIASELTFSATAFLASM
jgi:hypothetical protein